MRKIFLPLSLLFLLLLSSCGNSSEPAASIPVTSPAPSTSPTESSAPVPSLASPAPLETDKKSPFEKYRSALDNAGYAYEAVTMGAEFVGASSGEKYKFDFGTVELYRFDEGSDTLSKAVEDGGLTLEGFGVCPCHFNGSLAAIIDVTENEDALLDLFNSL